MIEAAAEFSGGESRVLYDLDVRGLRVRVSKRTITWAFFKEHRINGRRGATCKRLGFYPEMDTKAARRAALIEAGRVAAGRITPGKRAAVRFREALDDYIEHATDRAAKKGKVASWARNIKSLRNTHLDEFLNWPLADLSASPAVIAAWHKRVTKTAGPNIANQAARVLRATYRRAARLDRSLPPHNPTSAVEYNKESRSQNAIALADFPKWGRAWGRSSCRRPGRCPRSWSRMTVPG